MPGKKIFASLLIAVGLLPTLYGLTSTTSAQAAGGAKSALGVGVLLIVAGILLLRKKKKKTFAPALPVKAGRPAPYSTKNCPDCGERLALAADECEYCGSKQKRGANTCSGGVSTAAEARSSFSNERKQAKQAGSTHYVWRSMRDGSCCERCAGNDGKTFSWDEEPVGGHAGATPRCRCFPEAILPGCGVHVSRKPTQWELMQQEQEPKRRAAADEALQFVRLMLADNVPDERLTLRAFWGRFHILVDNDVTKALISLEIGEDCLKAIFYAKPEENPRAGGSRRVSLDAISDLEKHRPKIEAALEKYL